METEPLTKREACDQARWSLRLLADLYPECMTPILKDALWVLNKAILKIEAEEAAQ